jgi:peptidoglycan hydrolase-like protein with peptidoglycan-binding domain
MSIGSLNVGSFISIALRIFTHRDEVSKVYHRVHNQGRELETLIPQVQSAISESLRIMDEVNSLLRKVAPEVMSALPQQVQPVLDVKWLQTSLNTLMNAGLVVDGVYGQLTGEAVKKFQQMHGLTVDGWAGVQTEAKLLELLQLANHREGSWPP